MKNRIFLLLILVLCIFSCTKDKGKVSAKSKSMCDGLNVKFSTDINPIIQSKCAIPGCHGSGSSYGDFETNPHMGVSVKADAPLGNGSFRKRVIEGDPSFMPTSGPLSDLELEKIDCWLKAGAPNN